MNGSILGSMTELRARAPVLLRAGCLAGHLEHGLGDGPRLERLDGPLVVVHLKELHAELLVVEQAV